MSTFRKSISLFCLCALAVSCGGPQTGEPKSTVHTRDVVTGVRSLLQRLPERMEYPDDYCLMSEVADSITTLSTSYTDIAELRHLSDSLRSVIQGGAQLLLEKSSSPYLTEEALSADAEIAAREAFAGTDVTSIKVTGLSTSIEGNAIVVRQESVVVLKTVAGTASKAPGSVKATTTGRYRLSCERKSETDIVDIKTEFLQ